MRNYGQLRIRKILEQATFASSFRGSGIVLQCSSLGVRTALFNMFCVSTVP